MKTAIAEEVPMRLEIRDGIGLNFLFLIVGGLIFSFSFYILFGENNPPMQIIFGCIFLIFISLGMLLSSAWSLFKRTPLIIINQHGIEDRKFGYGLIEWADIKSIAVLKMDKNKYLNIEVVDPKKYLVRLSAVRRFFASGNNFLGVSDVCISISGLSHSVDEIHNFIFDNYLS